MKCLLHDDAWRGRIKNPGPTDGMWLRPPRDARPVSGMWVGAGRNIGAGAVNWLPMLRLMRLTLSGLCLPSLLAWAGTVWLWSRTAAVRLGSAAFAGTRYTVWAEGRLALYAPPVLAPAAARSTPNAAVVAQLSNLRNDDVTWCILADRPAGQVGTGRGMRASPLFRSPALFAMLPSTCSDPVLDRVLLSGLEDPQRFAAVHVAFVMRAGPLWEVSCRPGGRGVRADYDGMQLDLSPGEVHDSGGGPQYYRDIAGPWVDPSQLPAVRVRWHRRLDVAIRSVPLRNVIAGTAIPPLLWLGLRVRRRYVLRRRRKLGLCLRCGYDLTGNTSGRCSECGISRRLPPPTRSFSFFSFTGCRLRRKEAPGWAPGNARGACHRGFAGGEGPRRAPIRTDE